MLPRMIVAIAVSALCGATVQAQNFFADLDGLQESPPVVTTGSGFGTASYDSGSNMLNVNLTFSDLLSPTADSHIHCCFDESNRNAGVAIGFMPAGFPLDVTSGAFSHAFDLSDPNVFTGGFRNANGGTAAGARDALLAGMTTGTAYFNIHTVQFLSGEIRGDIAVPEPASLLLLLPALAAFAALRR